MAEAVVPTHPVTSSPDPAVTTPPDRPISGFTSHQRSRIASAGLTGIAGKIEAGARLDAADGVRLFEADLLTVGLLANRERERRHAGRTYFNYNIRLEATNVCVASCLFCSFARLKPGDPGAY